MPSPTGMQIYDLQGCKLHHEVGSWQLLVMSGEVWYLSYFNTEEIRTAMP